MAFKKQKTFLIGILLPLFSNAGIQCVPTDMQNTSGFEWNEFDRQTYKVAQRRCGELYKNSPCVKIFRKWGERDYSVLCRKASESIFSAELEMYSIFERPTSGIALIDKK